MQVTVSMLAQFKAARHGRWLRRTIKEDDRLMEACARSITVLEAEHSRVSELLDVFSHLSLGNDGRFEAGKHEFNRVMIEDALDKFRTYLATLHDHMATLITQLVLQEQDFEFLGKLGFTVGGGEP